LGIAKTFGITDKQALYDISYQNAILYSSAMPMPKDEDNDGDALPYDETKDANNPDLFNDFADEETIRV
jgi:hypothetical protein